MPGGINSNKYFTGFFSSNQESLRLNSE